MGALAWHAEHLKETKIQNLSMIYPRYCVQTSSRKKMTQRGEATGCRCLQPSSQYPYCWGLSRGEGRRETKAGARKREEEHWSGCVIGSLVASGLLSPCNKELNIDNHNHHRRRRRRPPPWQYVPCSAQYCNDNDTLMAFFLSSFFFFGAFFPRYGMEGKGNWIWLHFD